MKQTGYHTTHHDTGGVSSGERLKSGASSPLYAEHFVPPSVYTPATKDGDGLIFTQSRKLRRLDLDGPSPLNLRVGDRLFLIKPGENRFFPPIPLEPGDTLLLEPLAAPTAGGRHE